MARVLAPVLRPRALDDQRADGRGGFVGEDAHAAPGGGVVDGLEGGENVKDFLSYSKIHLSSIIAPTD